MSGKVIQGFFIGGRIPAAITGGPQPAVQRKPVASNAPNRPMPGPPPAAFGGGTRPVQARAAPGRPPAAHAGPAVPIQRHGGSDSFAIDPVQVGLARGGGKPLPEAVLAKMEAAFGADFSAVRVHIGPQAARIGAVAFTTGNDLYFAPGQFQPNSVQGQQLIGHELAHVIQQRQGRVRMPGSGVAVVQDHALEAEADRLGMRAAMHRAAEHRPLQRKQDPRAAMPRGASLATRNALLRATRAGRGPSAHSAQPRGPRAANPASAEKNVVQAFKVAKVPNAGWRNANRTSGQFSTLYPNFDCADFSVNQRTAILDANSTIATMTNMLTPVNVTAVAGYISDVSNARLFRKGDVINSMAEVDHVIPFNDWGSNHPFNGRVISSFENGPNGVVPRPGAANFDVYAHQTVPFALNGMLGGNLGIVKDQPLSVPQLQGLLNAAHGGTHAPTHHAGNPLATVAQITNADMMAIYVNLPQ